MRLRLALAALLPCVLAGPARAQTDWFASLYTNEGVELRADERVFALYALLNGMGYDEAPLLRAAPVPSRAMHPVRLKVRGALRVEAADAEKLGAFFDAPGHARPADAYGRYVLQLKGPGAFERTAAAPEDLKGFEALLADGYARLKLADLFASLQAEYRSSLKSYHGVVDAPVGAVRRLLKLKEDEPPRVVLVVNLLDGQGKAYSTLAGEELWVVVGPAPTPDLLAVARELSRAGLEPLVGPKAGDAEGAALATDALSRAFAYVALGRPEAEIEAPLRELVKQVDAYGKSDKALDAFVAETVPVLLKDAGKEPAKDPAGKKPGKGK